MAPSRSSRVRSCSASYCAGRPITGRDRDLRAQVRARGRRHHSFCFCVVLKTCPPPGCGARLVRNIRECAAAPRSRNPSNFISKFISYNDRFGSRDDLVRMSGRAGGRPRRAGPASRGTRDVRVPRRESVEPPWVCTDSTAHGGTGTSGKTRRSRARARLEWCEDRLFCERVPRGSR